MLNFCDEDMRVGFGIIIAALTAFGILLTFGGVLLLTYTTELLTIVFGWIMLSAGIAAAFSTSICIQYVDENL